MKSLRKIFFMFLVTAFISSFSAVGASACDCEHESESNAEESLVSLDSDSSKKDVCLDCEACCVSHQHFSKHYSGSQISSVELSSSVKFPSEESFFKSNFIEVLKSPPKA